MRLSLLSAIVGIASLGLASCQQTGQSQTAAKTSALKDALKSGVITQQEYDAKVAQLPARMPLLSILKRRPRSTRP